MTDIARQQQQLLDQMNEQMSNFDNLNQLIGNPEMAASLDDVIDAVTKQKTRADSLKAFVDGLRAQVTSAGGDQKKIQAVFDGVNTNSQEIADAMVANTPDANAAGGVPGGPTDPSTLMPTTAVTPETPTPVPGTPGQGVATGGMVGASGTLPDSQITGTGGISGSGETPSSMSGGTSGTSGAGSVSGAGGVPPGTVVGVIPPGQGAASLTTLTMPKPTTPEGPMHEEIPNQDVPPAPDGSDPMDPTLTGKPLTDPKR